MAARFDLVTFDSPAPDDLAKFWSAAPRMVETGREDDDRWIVPGSTDGGRRIADLCDPQGNPFDLCASG